MLEYGDRYILIEHGDVFAGGWDQLIDCFGIDSETLEEFCRFHDYTYTLSLYNSADKLNNELHKLYKYLSQPNEIVDSSNKDYDDGIDTGFEHIAEKLKVIIESFEKDTY